MSRLGDVDTWSGVGLEEYGLAGTDGAEPENYNDYRIAGFGVYAPSRGIIDNPGLLAEVEEITADGLAVTPMLEISLADYEYVQTNGAPYPGMLALGDDGSTYQYEIGPDGIGFFKKLFKAGKKLVKGALKTGKKLLKKLPGGKYLVKLHNRLFKASMKLVKPLAKYVGPIARKLAPIAALVPGYGPAISAALYTTGKIAKIASQFGVRRDKKGRPQFKSEKQALAFKQALKAQAEAARRAGLHKKPGVLKAGSPEWSEKMRAAGVRS